jgi:hypothetical protein
MSVLAPLYALGLLAVAAPIVFHLIRRAPRSEVPFSSLMFLSPTPPRLSKRSRLDHVLLLILRAAALSLLAFAFMRPFLRQAARLDPGGVERKRVAVLIDSSASMRRGDLWKSARILAEEAIAGCSPGDELAVVTFDSTSRPVLGFSESATLDASRRLAVARARLGTLEPSWGATNLGQALIDAVAAFEDVADAHEKTGRMPRKVVLISDLQQGSRLDALGNFEWPKDVELELKTVAAGGTNAGLQWLPDPTEPDPSAAGSERSMRVRVSNDPGSRQESFELTWLDDKGAESGKPVAVYVPPGESRVVRVPRPAESAQVRSLRLKGDQHGFDNTLYLASERRDEATVLFIGNDTTEDPSGLFYYLQRVFPETLERTVAVVPRSPSTALALDAEKTVPLIVLTSETIAENASRLKAFVKAGGTILVVLNAPGRAGTLAELAEVAPFEVAESDLKGDVMLGEIAFDHPLFAPFAGPQFNDFTKIHFWKHRRLDEKALGDARAVARFENGDPAVVEKAVGKGRLVVLTSGWNPADSQLARSSKFVPLMTSLLEGRSPRALDTTTRLVNEPVPLPAVEGGSKPFVVHKPDGTTVTVAKASTSFDGTSLPGVYTVDTPDGPRSFAVNLDPAESQTSPLAVETLEQFGCRLAKPPSEAPDREQLRQMQNVELEGRQKVWRWVILAAIGVLIVETLLAGRLDRARPARAEALTS